MKIIVDKMPEKPEDCPFSTWNFSCYTCEYGTTCNVEKCNVLRPITDFCAKGDIGQLTENGFVCCMYPLVSRKGD